MATAATPRRFEVDEADPDALTLCASFQATARRYADDVALRTPDGSTELTWGDYAARVESIARGLYAVGVRRGDTVGLLMGNRPEFHLVDTAVFHLGAIPFSIYPTSAPPQIAHLYENAGCDVVVAEKDFLPALTAARGEGRGPTTFITLDGSADGARTLAEVESLGAWDADFNFEATWRSVEADDVLTLIYTSGTTGPPKGVEISHANMLEQVRRVASVLPIQAGDRITSYLPSAHIADRWSSHYNGIVLGVQITSVADLRTIAQALPAVRPTIWGGVPRVAEKLKAALEAGIAADPDDARRTAVQGAIALGVQRVQREQAGEELDEEFLVAHARAEAGVLSALRAKLGLDETRWILMGAAPLSRDVHEFLLGLGLPVIEMYGMSEASCIVSAVHPEDLKVGTVGPAIPGLETRVGDDDELLLRGPTIARGYRGQPEKTAESIDADGWLHTGDVVRIDDEGHITLIDRKKEIIINAAGKNMSPANIEGVLKSSSPLIGQAAVIGDGRRYNVALLVLDPDMAAAYAKEHALPDPSVVAVAADPGVQQAVADAVEEANARLARVEQIKRYELIAQEWLPGGDELTPTMKLKRKPIGEKYSAAIEDLYSEV